MNGFYVKTHHELAKVAAEELRDNAARIMADADLGIQTAIVAKDGSVQSVVGLNGVRYLPDPDPDPLDEILRLAVENAPEQEK